MNRYLTQSLLLIQRIFRQRLSLGLHAQPHYVLFANCDQLLGLKNKFQCHICVMQILSILIPKCWVSSCKHNTTILNQYYHEHRLL